MVLTAEPSLQPLQKVLRGQHLWPYGGNHVRWTETQFVESPMFQRLVPRLNELKPTFYSSLDGGLQWNMSSTELTTYEKPDVPKFIQNSSVNL